jgi:hypothetical protein
MSAEEQKACVIVERLARSIGKDCQIIFTNDGVSIAPLSWSGDSFGDTLATAFAGGVIL